MRRSQDRLRDILEAIDAIQSSAAGHARAAFFERFEEERDFADALSFRIVVIGECVSSLLAESSRAPLPWLEAEREVDWSGWIGLRNVVAHQYFRRDPRKVWETIRELPVLRRAVARALASGEGPE